MAEFNRRGKLEISATLTLGESELRALDALVGYGIKPFLEVFYAKLGRAYLEPHERGLCDLFKTIGATVPGVLHEVDDARRVFTGERIAVHPDMPDRLGRAGAQVVELGAQLGEKQLENLALIQRLEALQAEHEQLKGRLAEVRDNAAPKGDSNV